MSKQIISQNFEYIFYWNESTKEYINSISTFNEMVLIIRNLFKEKFFEEISIKIFYMDVDEDSFEIHSQNEFQQVKDYHSKMPEAFKDKYRMRIRIYEINLDISSLLSSSTLNIAESKAILYDNKFGESLLPKNKKALIDKDNSASNFSKELKSIKDMIALHNQDIKDYFREILEKKISNYDNKIEMLSKEINQLKENREINKINDKTKNVKEFQISKEACLEYENNKNEKSSNYLTNCNNKNKHKNHKITKKENKNQYPLKDQEIFLNDVEENDIYICTICFINNAKFTCVICENLFLCNRCEYSNSHSLHPRVSLSTIPHFNLENLSKTVYSKNNFSHDGELFDKTYKNDFHASAHEKKVFYLDLNKNFFGKNLCPIKIEVLINSIEGIEEKVNDNMKIFKMKFDENLRLPIKIKNLSNYAIKPFELLITTRENHPLKIENNLIKTKINKNGLFETFLEIKSNNDTPGDFKFEIDLFHISRKVEYNQNIIIVNLNENLKLTQPFINEKSQCKETTYK